VKNKAVIFDFDDTIVSTKHNHITSFIEAAKKYDLTLKKNDIKKNYGLPTIVILQNVFPDESASKLKKIGKEKDVIYRKIVRKKGIRTFSGVRSLLQHLQKNQIKTGIMSADKVKNIKLVLKENDIFEYFQTIIGADVIDSHKPEPDGLVKTAKKISTDPKHCVFIGDSKYDMLAAKRAKMTPIGITTGFYSKNQLKSNGAQMTFEKHTDILDAIKSGKIKIKN